MLSQDIIDIVIHNVLTNAPIYTSCVLTISRTNRKITYLENRCNINQADITSCNIIGLKTRVNWLTLWYEFVCGNCAVRSNKYRGFQWNGQPRRGSRGGDPGAGEFSKIVEKLRKLHYFSLFFQKTWKTNRYIFARLDEKHNWLRILRICWTFFMKIQ